MMRLQVLVLIFKFLMFAIIPTKKLRLVTHLDTAPMKGRESVFYPRMLELCTSHKNSARKFTNEMTHAKNPQITNKSLHKIKKAMNLDVKTSEN